MSEYKNIPPVPQPSARSMTRRKFIKRSIRLAAALMVAPASGFGYARWVEPGWLETVSVDVKLPRLPQAWDGMRIIQFSDLHLGFYLHAEDLPPLVATINRLQPGLICFTGDLLDHPIDRAERTAAAKALAELHAPYGKYAVLGNHDYGGRPENAASLLSEAGFQVLRNGLARLEHPGGAFCIAGVEDSVKGIPDLGGALWGSRDEEFKLLLAHCPDFALTAANFPVDLQLSGHSHGGQVRIPFYGHVVTPLEAKHFVQGMYSLNNGKLQLYVNRGIGMSLLPVRFFCRPELTVITLRSAQSAH
ncbi:metallophosphoesterase [Paenibacillus ginsengihumi]|uniref:metallophosphoesterase n=1 Tax=Paenibacillus ginsengihumi TaxID=431596 RepID=UPI000366104C|nr:metallophosphoesterase [Paenibacillus ginsengihumi]